MQQASVRFLSPGLWTNECFFMKNDLVKFHERECDKFPFRVVMNVGPQIVKSSKQCVHEAFLDISFQIRDLTIQVVLCSDFCLNSVVDTIKSGAVYMKMHRDSVTMQYKAPGGFPLMSVQI